MLVPRATPSRAWIAIAVCAALPDLDAIGRPFGDAWHPRVRRASWNCSYPHQSTWPDRNRKHWIAASSMTRRTTVHRGGKRIVPTG